MKQVLISTLTALILTSLFTCCSNDKGNKDNKIAEVVSDSIINSTHINEYSNVTNSKELDIKSLYKEVHNSLIFSADFPIEKIEQQLTEISSPEIYDFVKEFLNDKSNIAYPIKSLEDRIYIYASNTYRNEYINIIINTSEDKYYLCLQNCRGFKGFELFSENGKEYKHKDDGRDWSQYTAYKFPIQLLENTGFVKVDTVIYTDIIIPTPADLKPLDKEYYRSDFAFGTGITYSNIVNNKSVTKYTDKEIGLDYYLVTGIGKYTFYKERFVRYDNELDNIIKKSGSSTIQNLTDGEIFFSNAREKFGKYEFKQKFEGQAPLNTKIDIYTWPGDRVTCIITITNKPNQLAKYRVSMIETSAYKKLFYKEYI